MNNRTRIVLMALGVAIVLAAVGSIIAASWNVASGEDKEAVLALLVLARLEADGLASARSALLNDVADYYIEYSKPKGPRIIRAFSARQEILPRIETARSKIPDLDQAIKEKMEQRPNEDTAAINRFMVLKENQPYTAFVIEAPKLIKRGNSAAEYSSLLAKANKVERKGQMTCYWFWWRNRQPTNEPDTLVRIMVDNPTHTIQSVDGNTMGQ